MAKFLKSDNRIVDIYLEFKVGCIEYKYTTHLKSDSSEFGVMETHRDSARTNTTVTNLSLMNRAL